MFRYIKNLRDKKTKKIEDITKLNISAAPKFKSKPEYKKWCSNTKTDSYFVTLQEGDCPSERISGKNPLVKSYGLAIDYDAPPDWDVMDELLQAIKSKYTLPMYIHKTYSGYVRTFYPFAEEEGLAIPHEIYPLFAKELGKVLGVSRCFAGLDVASYESAQVFHLFEGVRKVGEPLDPSVYKPVLFKCIMKKSPTSGDTSIPLEKVEEALRDRYENFVSWEGDFAVGSRGPLFFVDPFKGTEGCMVVEDGMVCFSTRAPKSFMTWKDLLGEKFITEYESEKYSILNDEFWYSGNSYYSLDEGNPVTISERLLALELQSRGFSKVIKPNKNISEVDAGILSIAKNNRVHEVAPCIWHTERVVRFNSNKILNNQNLTPIQPSEIRNPEKCKFLINFIEQLFDEGIDYFFAWWKRFYESVLNRVPAQGQCLIIVGGTNKGKTLLSNKIIGASVGGFADASDYIAGNTTFNKELAAKALWVVDDTVSASSLQDQRKATEINKRIIANPKIEVNAKYCNAVTVPWTGRVLMTTNNDANSLSVIPAMDSSNSDKILAIAVSEKASSKFPPNHELEAMIAEELPYLLRELKEMETPKKLLGNARYGVKGYIDPDIADASYDNSSRSSIAELLDWFCKRSREQMDVVEPYWNGTLIELQSRMMLLNDGKHLGVSSQFEVLRKGMNSLEEVSKKNDTIRPIRSMGKGGGKYWIIDLDEKYDLGDSTGVDPF